MAISEEMKRWIADIREFVENEFLYGTAEVHVTMSITQTDDGCIDEAYIAVSIEKGAKWEYDTDTETDVIGCLEYGEDFEVKVELGVGASLIQTLRTPIEDNIDEIKWKNKKH